MLQTILRNLYDNENMKLKRIRQKYNTMPKHTLTDEELNAYLMEQKATNMELYVAQLLMATYGLRVSSVAALQKKHLDFLYTNTNTITLPDVKTKTQRTELVNEEVKRSINEYIRDKEIAKTDFLFYQYGNDKSITDRSSYLCNLINKNIASTKAFNKSHNFKYTSHMFRKTKANSEYQIQLEKLKNEARARIGHKNSRNIKHYIDN